LRGIVTLCGSVRFRDQFDKVDRELTLAGWIVLKPGVWEHEWLHKSEHNAELNKNQLDALHCDKIRRSSCIVVINVNNYIGISTRNEMEFAKARSKKIFFLEIGQDWAHTMPTYHELTEDGP
jgi:hypothetical protein